MSQTANPTISIWVVLLALGIGLFLGLLPLLTNRSEVPRAPRRWSLLWLLPVGAVLLLASVVALLFFVSVRSSNSARTVVFDLSRGLPHQGVPSTRIVRNGDAGEIPDISRGPEPRLADESPVAADPQPAVATKARAISETRQIATTHIRARQVSDKPPTWISDRSETVKDNGRITEFSISSQWFASADEALDQVTQRTEQEVEQAFQKQHGVSVADLPGGALENSVVRDCHLERIIKDFGNGLREPMFRAYAQLKIDTTSGSPLHQYWAARLRYSNLWRMGIATACLTLCLAAFGQFLRWNRATEGRYRGRLITAATAVVAASATAAVLLPGWLLGSALR